MDMIINAVPETVELGITTVNTKTLPPSNPRLEEEYRKTIAALKDFLELPDSYHFLNFIDGPAGPVTTPAAKAYRRLRASVNASLHIL